MSQKSELFASIMAAIARRPGSHATRQAYESTAGVFVDFTVASGYVHMRRVTDIRGRHIKAFFQDCISAGFELGTLQNKAAHLRGILRSGGNEGVANAPELTNEMLHLSGRSRGGTKTAMGQDELQAFVDRATWLGRPGMGAALQLQFWLGLRGNEGIHARTDTLLRWAAELDLDGKLHVLAGTKGGRSREVFVHPADRKDALQAIEAALEIAECQGSFLIVRSRNKPSGGLKQARAIFHAFCNRSNVQPHAARYAFAQRQLGGYLAAGFLEREALILVSHDLGHGDGRGRYIRSVYTK